MLARLQFREALQRAEETHKITKTILSGEFEILGLFCLAVVNFWTGDLVLARKYTEASLAIYSAERHGGLANELIHDIKSAVLSFAAQYLWILGWPDQARKASDECESWAITVGHPFDTCWAHTVGAITYGFCGDHETFNRRIEAARTIADDQSIGFLEYGMIPTWWASGSIGHAAAEDIVASYEQGLPILEFTGLGATLPYQIAVMAHALAMAGRHHEASSVLERAFSMSEANQDHYNEPEMHRIAGELALHGPHPDTSQAEVHYLSAIETARSQDAKSWELRAAMSLARLWQGQDKRREARDLLAPVYDWFTEGFDTADLKDAKVLLGELQ